MTKKEPFFMGHSQNVKKYKSKEQGKTTVEKLLIPTEKLMYQQFICSLINILEYISKLLSFKTRTCEDKHKPWRCITPDIFEILPPTDTGFSLRRVPQKTFEI